MAPRLGKSAALALERDLQDAGPEASLNTLTMLASNYNCHISTTYRHKDRIGQGRPPAAFTGGPTKVVTWEMEQAVNALLEERPWSYQDEIQAFLHDIFDIQICQQSVSVLLQRMKITRKRLRVEAAQRSPELRIAWQYSLQDFEAAQIVCVDESGSNDKEGDRNYGWSTQGSKAVVRRWLQRKPRVSVLAAYAVDGYCAARTFMGTCTGDIFEDFIIDELLPSCNAYPQPKSVIVLDNASIHHANIDTIQRACDSKGVVLKFLPPYSPDFNPIEESFNDLKAFIRRHYRRERPNHTSYQLFLEWAVIQCGTGVEAGQRASAHFRNAGITFGPGE